MGKDTDESFEIPKTLDKLAEENIHKIQKTFDEFVSIMRKNAAVMEWRASMTQSGARDAWNKVIVFAERNIATSFDLAQHLIQAKSLRELVDLQTAFAQSQTQALAEQTTELGETLMHVISNSARPKKKVGA